MRKLLWFTVGFAAACAHCAYLFSGTVVIVIALALAALGAVMMFGAEKFKTQKVVAMVMLGLAVGFCWYQGYTGLRNAGADTLDGERHFLTVTASDYGYETNYGTAADGTLNYDETVYKVRVFVAGKVDIEPGDRIEGEFRIDYTGSNWNPEDALFFGRWNHIPAVWRRRCHSHLCGKGSLVLFPCNFAASDPEKHRRYLSRRCGGICQSASVR